MKNAILFPETAKRMTAWMLGKQFIAANPPLTLTAEETVRAVQHKALDNRIHAASLKAVGQMPGGQGVVIDRATATITARGDPKSFGERLARAQIGALLLAAFRPAMRTAVLFSVLTLALLCGTVAAKGGPVMSDKVTLTKGQLAAILCLAASSDDVEFAYDDKADRITQTIFLPDPKKNSFSDPAGAVERARARAAAKATKKLTLILTVFRPAISDAVTVRSEEKTK